MANQFLVKETMAAMRGLTAAEITALQNGTYDGVQLLGYYKKGDTPASIIYYYVNPLTDPDPGQDDGGSIIVTSNNVKLIHIFEEAIDVTYFGAKGDGVSPLEDTVALKNLVALGNKNIKFRDGEYIITERISLENPIKLSGRICDFDNSMNSKVRITFSGATGGLLLKNRWIVIENISLNCSAAEKTYPAIFIDADNKTSAYFSFKNLYIKGFQYGIYSFNAWIIYAERVLTVDCVLDGFYFKNGTTIELHNCFANGSGRYGYFFQGSIYSGLYSCASDSGAQYGYNIENAKTINISGCGAELNKIGIVRCIASNVIVDGLTGVGNGELAIGNGGAMASSIYAYNSRVAITGLSEYSLHGNATSPSISAVNNSRVTINNNEITKGIHSANNSTVQGFNIDGSARYDGPVSMDRILTNEGGVLNIDGRLGLVNSGRSTYVGENAGGNDDKSDRDNTGIGTSALAANTAGHSNTGIGRAALLQATIANANTSVGFQSGYGTTTGGANTFLGWNSGYKNNTGSMNTYCGYGSGQNINSGNNNTSIGHECAKYIADGVTAFSSSSNSIYIGKGVKASANDVTNEIVIGQGSIGKGSNTVVIGNTNTIATYLKGILTKESFETAPASLTAPGTIGQIRITSNGTFYICTGVNLWVRHSPATDATTIEKGLVKQAAATADIAPIPSSTYSQLEVQAILTELRDLKTKLQGAGILAL